MDCLRDQLNGSFVIGRQRYGYLMVSLSAHLERFGSEMKSREMKLWWLVQISPPAYREIFGSGLRHLGSISERRRAMVTLRQIGKIQVVETEPATQEDLLDVRFSGALMGGAIADALGWPTEFARSPADLDRVNLTYPLQDFVPWPKRVGGRFFARTDYIQPGDYSDDTQLTLSVARSLNPDGTVDNQYFAKQELRYWLTYARGAGATITAAAKAATRSTADWRWNFFRFKRGRHDDLDYRGAGANGAAMRVAPIALANLYDPRRVLMECWKNSIVTHGHARAIMGAIIYAEALRRVIENAIHHNQEKAADFVDYLCNFVNYTKIPDEDPDIDFWLSQWNAGVNKFEQQWATVKEEMVRLLRLTMMARSVGIADVYRALGCFDPATKGSGTVTVAAAIMVFLTKGNNFKTLALEAANQLGSDTDTIGAMAATLAGGWLGYTEVPQRWANLMADYTYLNRIAETLTLIALRRLSENPLRLKKKPPTAIGDLLSALKRQMVVKGHTYHHPLLGDGKVIHVDAQEVGRPRVKGRVITATVQFEMGQTCKLSSYTGLPVSNRHR
jgi:ADP-ribosylglycohydrolase